MTPPIRTIALAAALLALPALLADAATMSAGPAAPAVDGEDIAHVATATGGVVAPTGADKWWPSSATSFGNAGMTVGQTFTTGSGVVRLTAITFQVRDGTTATASQPKTYTIRVGEIAGANFTEIASETAVQEFGTADDDYWTWTFDAPVLLSPNTVYGIDVGLNSSGTSWQDGIPYVHVVSNGSYTGGTRFRSGTAGNGIGDGTISQTSGDRIFHVDLERPFSSTLEFVAGNPADDAVDALIPPVLEATFSQNLAPGTGNITVRDLTGSIDTTLAVSDPRITLSENLLRIDTAGLIDWSRSYAIRIDPGAVENDSGEGFAGIADDATWNFTTAAGDPLLDAVAELKDHLNGVITLSGAQIEAHKLTLDAERNRFDESAATIGAVFDLVTTYDTVFGPLFVSGSTVTGFNRGSVSDQDIHWVIYTVMQYIMDEVYNPGTLADPLKRAPLEAYDRNGGYKFGSSAHFPGSLPPPADPTNTHTVAINGSFPETFGRDTQQWTLPARKPTGTYLAPGTIATVTVPPALVDQGYQVRVGAHSWDMSNRPPVKRLERATIVYPLDAGSIEVASPYGGGIYIEVPLGADAGVVNVDITGAVRAPYFSAKSFHTTTASEWNTTERSHPAPWADFQTDKFMMQVSREWIYAMSGANAVQLMADWDAAMDAINDLMGFPRIRGKETMYIQTDLIFRSSVHAPGYPATNVNFNPNGSYNGYQNNYFVRGPQSGAGTEFHEQGHAYFFPKFGGETEANVNLPYVAVRNRAFGMDFDTAFRQSVGYGNFNNVTVDTLDNTAVLWMTSFNFAPREQPMGSWEKAYQPQGHARWVDIARLYGWEGLGAYWESFMVDDANGTSYSNNTDSLLLRLCKNVGEDIRPLFHFWGIHPQNPTQLANDVAAEGLTPPVEIYDLLVRYKSLVPADNAAYQAWCLYSYGRAPRISGFGVEREKTRQFDNTSYWVDGGWQYSGTAATNPDGTPVVDDGEIYLAASATRIEDRMQELIDLYYPGGRPASDYENWAALYPGHDLSDPTGDLDGDGLSNDYERLFGLDPTSATSSDPVTVPFDGDGEFEYTRRTPTLTGSTYSVWYTTDLVNWDEDTGANEIPGPPDAQDVETVTMSVSSELLEEPKLFIQVRVE